MNNCLEFSEHSKNILLDQKQNFDTKSVDSISLCSFDVLACHFTKAISDILHLLTMLQSFFHSFFVVEFFTNLNITVILHVIFYRHSFILIFI